MVSMSTVVAAIVESMENTGKNYEDVETAVCNLKYNIWERENDCPNDIFSQNPDLSQIDVQQRNEHRNANGSTPKPPHRYN